MDYEKKYKEILEWARKNKARLNGVPIEEVLPELAESDDERIRKALIWHLKAGEDFVSNGITKDQAISYLEKQKEPVVDREGMYYYLGGKFIYCGYPATEENPYDFAISQQEKQKECVADSSKTSASEDERIRKAIIGLIEELQRSDKYFAGVKLTDMLAYLEKHKEPHYANKRVDDIMNMPELSAFEQALTNFIGYWEDDEEHWPSQFVKKHGKHILDMAREELQKEQKQVPFSCGHENGTPAEWSEEDEEMIGCIIDDIREAKRNSDKEYFKELCDKEIAWLKSIRPDTFQNGNSRPKSPDNWKPSEEQIEALHTAVYLEEMQFYGGLKDKLRDLYEQLKKL